MLPGVASLFPEGRHGEPLGVVDQQAGSQAGRSIHGAGCEEDALHLHHVASADQFPQLAPVHAVRRRGDEGGGGQSGHERVVGQRVGHPGGD